MYVDGCRPQIQNRPVTRSASSIIATALALALVVVAWTKVNTPAGASGAGPGGDGLRNSAPSTAPRMIVETPVTVGPHRVVYPPTAAFSATTDRPATTNSRLLDTRYSEHPHDQPHLHALPLLI